MREASEKMLGGLYLAMGKVGLVINSHVGMHITGTILSLIML